MAIQIKGMIYKENYNKIDKWQVNSCNFLSVSTIYKIFAMYISWIM